MEAVHGNRTDPDKLSAAQSGRAMELLNQGLIWLADRLRVSYGQGGLLSLLSMVCAASAVVDPRNGGLVINGKRYRDLKADGLSLRWPRWYAPTAEDRQQEATTLNVLINAGVLSRQTATRIISETYDIADADAEMALIAAERQAADDRAASLAAQVKATETLPA